MFKTLDNTSVYDKEDIDEKIGTDDSSGLRARIKSTENDVTNLKTSKASAQELNNLATRTHDLETTMGNNDTSGIRNRIRQNENNISTLSTNKADKSYVDTELRKKANASEIPNLVNSAIDSAINAKIAAVDIPGQVTSELTAKFNEADIPGKVTEAVGNQFQNYDDSNTVDSKISTAIGNLPAAPTAMTTTEATALINTYF